MLTFNQRHYQQNRVLAQYWGYPNISMDHLILCFKFFHCTLVINLWFFNSSDIQDSTILISQQFIRPDACVLASCQNTGLSRSEGPDIVVERFPCPQYLTRYFMFVFFLFQAKISANIGALIQYLPREMLYTLILIFQ